MTASSAAVEFQRSLGVSRFNVVVATPNLRLRSQIAQRLMPGRWQVFQVGCTAASLELLLKHDRCVLLLDSTMPDFHPEGHHALKDLAPAQAVLMNSQTGQLLMGAEASPVAAELVRAVNCRPALPSRESRHFSMDTGVRYGRDVNRLKLRGMIGSAASMQYLWNVARRVAALKTTILITGESGTGKDLLAQEIHLISQRRNEPFVIVNCSEISENSLEADLFGYAKGAFTGAVESRIGRIHAASLFLDQIGAMPLSLQGKILRFLDQGEVQRLGGKGRLKVDVRVIAASDVDLKD